MKFGLTVARGRACEEEREREREELLLGVPSTAARFTSGSCILIRVARCASARVPAAACRRRVYWAIKLHPVQQPPRSPPPCRRAKPLIPLSLSFTRVSSHF